MHHIAIISASVRTGRNSHRVALYFQRYLEENNLASCELLDLQEYNFPVFNERLKYQKDPLPQALQFAGKIASAAGAIIVTPEYNGGYPASLKNVTDLLYDEWQRKPVAIATVSSGSFGGSQVLMALQFSLWKMHVWTVPAMFPVPNVKDAFDENGVPSNPEKTGKRAKAFIEELLWCVEAKKKMEG